MASRPAEKACVACAVVTPMSVCEKKKKKSDREFVYPSEKAVLERI